MKKKDLIFCITIITIVAILRKTPKLASFSLNWTDDTKHLVQLGFEVIIISACWWIAKKYKLLQTGGFISSYGRNYGMLLIPFFFPGALFLPSQEFSCFSLTYTIITHAVLVLIMGLTEEVVFRGCMMGYLRKQYPHKSINS